MLVGFKAWAFDPPWNVAYMRRGGSTCINYFEMPSWFGWVANGRKASVLVLI